MYIVYIYVSLYSFSGHFILFFWCQGSNSWPRTCQASPCAAEQNPRPFSHFRTENYLLHLFALVSQCRRFSVLFLMTLTFWRGQVLILQKSPHSVQYFSPGSSSCLNFTLFLVFSVNLWKEAEIDWDVSHAVFFILHNTRRYLKEDCLLVTLSFDLLDKMATSLLSIKAFPFAISK